MIVMAIEIIPTVVPASLKDVYEVAERYKGFASSIHIDVADGIFAPNTTWTPADGEKLPSGMNFEIHMMTANPHELGEKYARAGAHSLIGHVEAFGSADKAKTAYDAWRKAGAKEAHAGVLFQTEVESLGAYVLISDRMLFMTIATIGTQGIPFTGEPGIARIARFHELFPEAIIEVDGGISFGNIESLRRVGCSHFCAGSVISKAESPAEVYADLMRLVEAAV